MGLRRAATGGRDKRVGTALASSWEGVGAWYDDLVGKEGHHYHQNTLIPGALRLLQLNTARSRGGATSVLDLGCGQGVLGRQMPTGVKYVGIDSSKFLVDKAIAYDKARHHRYIVADATQPYKSALEQKKTRRGDARGDCSFSHATFVLSLQNMSDQAAALRLASAHLHDQGRLVIVLNHPCFRVPRQSRWGIDPQNNTQYRRIDRYQSTLRVPIYVHPGRKDDTATYSYHHPLEYYFRHLSEAGMAVETVEEWYSNKTSEGGQAKRENRARSEFPQFLAISSFKNRAANRTETTKSEDSEEKEDTS